MSDGSHAAVRMRIREYRYHRSNDRNHRSNDRYNRSSGGRNDDDRSGQH